MDMSSATPDPESLIQCPFDPSHMIRVKKMPYHIIACKKSNPMKARNMTKCPFNASHVVHKSKMDEHLLSCPNRNLINNHIVHAKELSDQRLMASRGLAKACNNFHIDSEENWEEELTPSYFMLKSNEVATAFTRPAPDRCAEPSPIVGDRRTEMLTARSRLDLPVGASSDFLTGCSASPNTSKRPIPVSESVKIVPSSQADIRSSVDLPTKQRATGITTWAMVTGAKKKKATILTGNQRNVCSPAKATVPVSRYPDPSTSSRTQAVASPKLCALTEDTEKLERKLTKKLKEIGKLLEKQDGGQSLNNDELAKIAGELELRKQLKKLNIKK